MNNTKTNSFKTNDNSNNVTNDNSDIVSNNNSNDVTNDKNLDFSGKRPLLCPKYDVVFQSLFSNRYKELTGYFLSAILNRRLSVLGVHTEYSAMRNYPEEKVGRLDLLAQLDDASLVHIELQLINQHNTLSRLFYASSKIVSNQLVRGDEYSMIRKTISIALTNFTPDELQDDPKFHSVFSLYDKDSEKSLTNLIEYHIINLALAEEEYKVNSSDLLAQWALFILDPNRKEILSIMEDNKDIKEAFDTLEDLSEDDILRERAEILKRWEIEEKWNKQSNINYGKELGIKEGIEKGKEQGIKEGLKKGKEQGLKDGISQGERAKTLEIAKEMLKENLDINVIVRATKLSKEEILKLKD